MSLCEHCCNLDYPAAEPTSFKISNPGRVTLQQQQFVSFAEQRYRPVLPIKRGIVMLIDSAPERPEELVEPEAPSEGKSAPHVVLIIGDL